MIHDMHTTIIDEARRTVRPAQAHGNEFYGLTFGSNGTAAECRRRCAAPEGFTWLRHDGRPAVGLTAIPSGFDDVPSPWSGRPTPPRPPARADDEAAHFRCES